MANDDVPDVTGILTQVMRAGLAALSTPEAVAQLATFSRTYYDALRARGFSDGDALTLGAPHGAGLMRGGK